MYVQVGDPNKADGLSTVTSFTVPPKTGDKVPCSHVMCLDGLVARRCEQLQHISTLRPCVPLMQVLHALSAPVGVGTVKGSVVTDNNDSFACLAMQKQYPFVYGHLADLGQTFNSSVTLSHLQASAAAVCKPACREPPCCW